MEMPRADLDLSGLRSYIYRLAERLSVVLSSLDENNFTSPAAAAIKSGGASSKAQSELKESIIRTASLIKSVEEKLTATMKSEYAAVSDIGTYTQEAIASYEVGGRGIGQYFSLIESVSEEVRRLCGYVKSGVLDDGTVGIEIGSFGSDGETPFKVRLSDHRLSFFDGGIEVAYLSDSSLYITKASVTGKAVFGNYELDLTDGVAWRWNG